MIKKHHNSSAWLLALATVVSLVSCTGEDDLRPADGQQAIAFASATAEEESVTRAATALGHDFVVYGYKTMADNSVQTVFDGYSVKYNAGSANTSETNTKGYEYVVGAQTIKYWDFGASEYRFWGATAPADLTDPTYPTWNADGTSLAIPMKLSTTEPTEVLYSQLYRRVSPIKSDVVELQFKRPYAKMRVMFYTTDPLTGSGHQSLTHITFGGGTNSIVTDGSLVVNYPKSGNNPATGTAVESVAQSATSSQDNLSFNDVDLNATHGIASDNAVCAVPTGGTEWYYVMPASTGVTVPPFTMSLKLDGVTKTADVPSAYMQWLPNVVYTYIFKISATQLALSEVLVAPWKYGGDQDEEWKNW